MKKEAFETSCHCKIAVMAIEFDIFISTKLQVSHNLQRTRNQEESQCG